MSDKIIYKAIINGEEWTPCHIERLEYERNLHILHSMKRHGIDIKDGEKILTDDDIDCLSQKDAWRVSIDTRLTHTGEELVGFYRDSLNRSDEMWRELQFSMDRPMKVSHCDIEVQGVSLEAYVEMIGALQEDERNGLAAHPEHFQAFMTNQQINGIEPFGMYGTPTLVDVGYMKLEDAGAQIQADNDPEYPLDMIGSAFLTDGTPVNVPYHQFRATENGFAAKTAVYWPENTPDEIVNGHCLHLAMEFYEGILQTQERLESNAAKPAANGMNDYFSTAEKVKVSLNGNSTLEDVLQDAVGFKIAEKHLGKLLDRPAVAMMKGKSLNEIEKMIPIPGVKGKVTAIIQELENLN